MISNCKLLFEENRVHFSNYADEVDRLIYNESKSGRKEDTQIFNWENATKLISVCLGTKASLSMVKPELQHFWFCYAKQLVSTDW